MNCNDASRSHLTRRAAAALLFCAALLPAACATEPAPARRDMIGFAGSPRIGLDVASIAVDDRYNSPGKPPYVEHIHPQTPAGIAQRWADDKLVAAGSRGIATLTILDGSVTEEKLATKGGVEGFFGDQLDTRLRAHLKARLTVSRPGTQPGESSTFSADVNATGERTILQSASLNERDAAYDGLMRSLAQQFDSALEAEVRRTMRPVILY